MSTASYVLIGTAEAMQQTFGSTAGSMSGLAEEAPAAYKNVSRVVELVHKLGIGRKITRLEPVTVVKA